MEENINTNKIYFFDTTLRDGQQTTGVDFSVEDKIKMANILLKTNLPLFHYSIIPFLRQAFEFQKLSYFSISYRISETFNQRKEYWI